MIFAVRHDADIRLLIRQAASTPADHERENRLTRDALRAVLEVDTTSLRSGPLREGIMLFDDVLNSGKHFKESVRRLRGVMPNEVPVAGIFIARCVHPNPVGDLAVIP